MSEMDRRNTRIEPKFSGLQSGADISNEPQVHKLGAGYDN